MVRLDVGHIQQRDGRWAIVDLLGNGRRVRTVPMPAWAKADVDRWIAAAGIDEGRVFRSLRKGGHGLGGRLSGQAVASAVERHASPLGLTVAPYDLRRTYAKLARKGQAPIEQIQVTLGHARLDTTQRLVGIEIDYQDAPCDRLGLRP